MSRELFKMNMIASVQKLDNEDIEIIQNYIETIEQENKQLKELCNKYEEEHKKEFNTWLQGQKVLVELEEWLKEKINYIVNYIDKSKVKPYGEELRMLENCANRYNDVLDKIQKLKEKYK